MPSLWLDLFTANTEADVCGVLYLHIVAPLYELFGASQVFYFASQPRYRIFVAASYGKLTTNIDRYDLWLDGRNFLWGTFPQCS